MTTTTSQNQIFPLRESPEGLISRRRPDAGDHGGLSPSLRNQPKSRTAKFNLADRENFNKSRLPTVRIFNRIRGSVREFTIDRLGPCTDVDTGDFFDRRINKRNSWKALGVWSRLKPGQPAPSDQIQVFSDLFKSHSFFQPIKESRINTPLLTSRSARLLADSYVDCLISHIFRNGISLGAVILAAADYGISIETDQRRGMYDPSEESYCVDVFLRVKTGWLNDIRIMQARSQKTKHDYFAATQALKKNRAKRTAQAKVSR